jgi:teichuronic acid biosynthesis glycosyltransferase TuaC
VKVLVLAEYYPSAADPSQGVWAHRQALAARDAGAQVRVLVLHRPIPPMSAIRERDLAAAWRTVRQPETSEIDGLQVEYVRYLSPPRPWSYDGWGAWAAPPLAHALRRVRRSFSEDLIHAHYAVPAGDAVRRAAPHTPLLVSVHGHDVYGDMARARNVRAALGHADLVLANSRGTELRSRAHGARQTRVVHLGAPVPAHPSTSPGVPTLVTVGNLVQRKRHQDVICALALLRERQPELRYVIVGDGPERERLRALAAHHGLQDRVQLVGRLGHEQALRAAGAASLFVLPSVDEAFGVAYVEAMAHGVPAIGSEGEDGPEEIAAAGGGMELVPPRDPHALADLIDALLTDPSQLGALGRAARKNVAQSFTWERCGRETVRAYEDVLAAGDSARRPAPIAPPP